MVTEERRKYPRLNLLVEDGYFGNFALKNEKLIAPIINLSAGGLNIALQQSARDKIKEGDTLALLNISGGTNLKFLININAEIRWIKALNSPGYVSVGCKFLNLAGPVRQQIIQFVDTERMARGQYS